MLCFSLCTLIRKQNQSRRSHLPIRKFSVDLSLRYWTIASIVLSSIHESNFHDFGVTFALSLSLGTSPGWRLVSAVVIWLQRSVRAPHSTFFTGSRLLRQGSHLPFPSTLSVRLLPLATQAQFLSSFYSRNLGPAVFVPRSFSLHVRHPVNTIILRFRFPESTTVQGLRIFSYALHGLLNDRTLSFLFVSLSPASDSLESIRETNGRE